MRTTGAFAVVLLALTTIAPRAAPPSDLVGTYLHDRMGFSNDDVKNVRAGRAVAKQMKIKDAIEVNIFGAVRVAAPPEGYIQQLRHIDVYERKLNILQVGKFQNPPQLDDLRTLTLDTTDFDALADCRPGDCSLQLPADAMTRFHTQVDWRSRDARDQANRVFRQMMFDLLQTYRHGGSAALGAYTDRSKPTPIAAEFGLLSSPGDTPIEIPDLARVLTDFPNATLGSIEDFFYWNKGEFGMKPTTRLNHVMIYPFSNPPGSGGGVRFVVATKQLFSNHYFSATLKLRTIVDDAERPGQGFYLLYTTKSRVSGLTGFIGTLIRPIVRSRARSGMERYLANTKRTIEISK